MSDNTRFLEIELKDGTLDGFIKVTQDNLNILFVCPRDEIKDLLKREELKKYGIYFLLSDKTIYVGQSKNLDKRTKEHMAEEGWTKCILWTKVGDSYEKGHIDYLERQLIHAVRANSPLKNTNIDDGHDTKLKDFTKDFLDQDISKLYFLLHLLGITCLEPKSKLDVPLATIGKASKQPQLKKKDFFKLLKSNGVNTTNSFTFASKQKKKPVYWLNPDPRFIKENWTVVLNNQQERKLIVMLIPKNSLVASKNPKKGMFKIRNDRNGLDMNIFVDSLVEQRSRHDFSKYVIKTISY
jgi:hypothetical protein